MDYDAYRNRYGESRTIRAGRIARGAPFGGLTPEEVRRVAF